MELVNTDGIISKKKLIDGAKTIAFKALPIIKTKHTNPDEKYTKPGKTIPQTAGAKLIIEEPSISIKKELGSTPTSNTKLPDSATATAPKTPLGSLSKIRQQITQQNINGNTESIQLIEEELYICWGLFVEKLRSKSNHSAVTNFKAAELKIIDNNTIEIVTQGEIHRAFIEEQRAGLITHLQQHFNNRLLVYRILVIEKADAAAPTDTPLSKKQQYLKIIEEYPLVKELKERLKLELD